MEPRHVELQERALALRRRGVLLALCSRNVEADVWEAIEAGGTPVRREHLAASRIAPALRKSAAVAEIATELGLGLESVLLIDDNAAECAEVRATLPELAVWCWPSSHQEAKLQLQHTWQLDLALRGAPTDADVGRADGYRAQAEWRAARGGARDAAAVRALHEQMQVHSPLMAAGPPPP